MIVALDHGLAHVNDASRRWIFDAQRLSHHRRLLLRNVFAVVDGVT
jgi:hypothetical protein